MTSTLEEIDPPLCAFSGPPEIIRLHGRGEVILPKDEREPVPVPA